MTPTAPLRIDTEEQEGRYSRLQLIPWWNQQKIRAARVLVIGAGALGNEILKNLALLGFRKIVVVDLDRIEMSNLSRAVLFRSSDVGLAKAEAIVKPYLDLCPEATVRPLRANVMEEVGLGLFAWADIILAGLDNREARLWINRAAWKVNRPWVDGAIEGINGVARVFVPGKPPCYECTLGETDWALLERRMSCNLLLQESTIQGKIPTTPTISSIIGGIQSQEAVKILHGLETLAGRGFVFEGLHHSSYVVEYTQNPDCLSHYTFPEVMQLAVKSPDVTLEQLLARSRADLNAEDVVIEFSREIIHKLICPQCGVEDELFVPVGSVTRGEGRCPDDGSMRVVQTLSGYRGEPELGSRTLDNLGLPLFDIFTAKSPDREISYCVAGDAPAVLGSLSVADGEGR